MPAGRRRIHVYALRMRLESTFQNTKSRGWDLEASLIADLERLNRLLLALFVAMWRSSIWSLPVSIMASVLVLVGMIDEIKACFGWAVSG